MHEQLTTTFQFIYVILLNIANVYMQIVTKSLLDRIVHVVIYITVGFVCYICYNPMVVVVMGDGRDALFFFYPIRVYWLSCTSDTVHANGEGYMHCEILKLIFSTIPISHTNK